MNLLFTTAILLMLGLIAGVLVSILVELKFRNIGGIVTAVLTPIASGVVQALNDAKTALANVDQKIVKLGVKIDALVAKFAAGQVLTTEDITAISNAKAELFAAAGQVTTDVAVDDTATGISDPTSITMTPNPISVIVGQSVQLKVVDSDADDVTAEPSTKYVSDTPAIATVDTKGNVTGVSAGAFNIGATDSFGNSTSVPGTSADAVPVPAPTPEPEPPVVAST